MNSTNHYRTSIATSAAVMAIVGLLVAWIGTPAIGVPLALVGAGAFAFELARARSIASALMVPLLVSALVLGLGVAVAPLVVGGGGVGGNSGGFASSPAKVVKEFEQPRIQGLTQMWRAVVAEAEHHGDTSRLVKGMIHAPVAFQSARVELANGIHVEAQSFNSTTRFKVSQHDRPKSAEATFSAAEVTADFDAVEDSVNKQSPIAVNVNSISVDPTAGSVLTGSFGDFGEHGAAYLVVSPTDKDVRYQPTLRADGSAFPYGFNPGNAGETLAALRSILGRMGVSLGDVVVESLEVSPLRKSETSVAQSPRATAVASAVMQLHTPAETIRVNAYAGGVPMVTRRPGATGGNEADGIAFSTLNAATIQQVIDESAGGTADATAWLVMPNGITARTASNPATLVKKAIGA